MVVPDIIQYQCASHESKRMCLYHHCNFQGFIPEILFGSCEVGWYHGYVVEVDGMGHELSV